MPSTVDIDTSEATLDADSIRLPSGQSLLHTDVALKVGVTHLLISTEPGSSQGASQASPSRLYTLSAHRNKRVLTYKVSREDLRKALEGTGDASSNILKKLKRAPSAWIIKEYSFPHMSVLTNSDCLGDDCVSTYGDGTQGGCAAHQEMTTSIRSCLSEPLPLNEGYTLTGCKVRPCPKG